MDRPSVFLVLTDQQRHDWVGNDPAVPVRTLNLNALSERGIHFTNVVCPSSLCVPSRTCLASGTEYDRCGITDNENYPFERPTNYARLRGEADYETIGVGDDLSTVDGFSEGHDSPLLFDPGSDPDE